MSAATDTRLRGRTRWSAACRCPRQAAMGLLGHEPEPVDDQTRLLWERGKLDEQWVIDKILEPEFGFDNIIRQKAVEWPATGLPIGELHSDAFVVSEGMPVEIKSHANGEPSDHDFVQLEGQLAFDPDAKGVGTLIVVDRNLQRQMIPVKLTDDGRARVEGIAGEVIEAGRTGVLPARTCEHPSEGRGKFCPFISDCFAGWEAPAAVEVAAEHQQLLAEAFRLKQRADRLKEPWSEAQAEYDAAKEALTALPVGSGVELAGGGVIAKRTDVAARSSFDLKEARRAGIYTGDDETRFAPFVKPVGAHTRWTLKRDESVPLLAEDFGDEAPWSDADLEAPVEF